MVAEGAEAVSIAGCEGGASLLAVRAQPGARRAGIAGVWNDRLKVAVAAPPEDGRANKELLSVLARALELRSSQLTLHSGERSRQKTIRVELAPAELRARLRPHLEDEAHLEDED